MSEKNEKPTRKRLREARERGEVVKSKEVTATIGYIVLIISMIFMLPWLWKRLERLFALVWSEKVMQSAADSWPNVLLAVGEELVELALPVALIIAAATVAGAFAQVRGIFSVDPVLPKFNRLNPAEGFKNLFASQNLLNLLKLMLRLVLISTIIVWVIMEQTEHIMRLMYGGQVQAAQSGARILLLLFGAVGGLYIVFAAIDYAHQYYEYMKKLRMSKDEIKREHKDLDGNPEIKNARRRLAHELAFSTPGEATRGASAVVVNPTHFAVAIFYEPGVTDLPIVVEKGVDDQALFLRRVASEAGVPIFEYPALARKLFDSVGVFSYIPQELFPAVAEVLNWVRGIKSARPMDGQDGRAR